VTDWPHHQDLLLQHISFDHLLKVNSLRPVTSNDEANIGICSNDARYGGNEQISAFVVIQSRDDDYGDDIVRTKRLSRTRRGAVLRIVRVLRKRPEVVGNNSIGNDRDHRWVQRGSKDGVLFTRVTDAYDMVDVTQSELQELVREDGPSISKAKETVVCKNSPQAHGTGMQDGFVA